MRRGNKKSSKNANAGGSSSQRNRQPSPPPTQPPTQQQNYYVPQFDPSWNPSFPPHTYQNPQSYQVPSPQPHFSQPNWYSPQNWFPNSSQTPFQTQSPQPYHTPSPQFVAETQEEEEEEQQQQQQQEEEEEEEEGQSSRGKGKAPRKNWTQQEEIILARSWCDVSSDSERGDDRPSQDFWKLVTARFHAELMKGPDYRNHHQLNSKWNKMNREVQKFNGCYVNLRNQYHSGENEDDLLDRATQMYQQDTFKKWVYGHAWRVVKDNPKWNHLPNMADVAKRGTRRAYLSTQHLRNSTVDVDDDESTHEPSSQPLPMGRDQAKKKSRTSGSSSSRSEEYGELRNRFDNMNRSIDRRNELRAYEVFMKDISHLEGDAYEAALNIRAKIKRDYGF